jgi:hypothetical protein
MALVQPGNNGRHCVDRRRWWGERPPDQRCGAPGGLARDDPVVSGLRLLDGCLADVFDQGQRQLP